MVSDIAIAERVMRLNQRHVKLSAQKHLKTPKELSKRTIFKTDMEKMFDIAPNNCIEIIQADKLRSLEAQEEDISFYLYQHARIGSVSKKRDLDYDESVEDKEYRGGRNDRLRGKDRNRNLNNNVVSTEVAVDDDEKCYSDSDTDTEKVMEKVLNRSRKRKI